jgi:hypothetical protein
VVSTQWIGAASVGPSSFVDGHGLPKSLVFRHAAPLAHLLAVVADAFDDENGLKSDTHIEGNAFSVRLFAILAQRFL